MTRNTILVVDDDDGIRDSVSEWFRLYGWKVLSASCLEQASEYLRTDIANIAIVVSDDHMGGFGLNGSDLYNMRSTDLQIHGIPFILMTGTSRMDFIEAARAYGMLVIQKPIRLHVLSSMLRTLLGQSSAPSFGSREL